MNGPEHYREAERLLHYQYTNGVGGTVEPDPDVISLAQVHATLALAAATVENEHGEGLADHERDEWRRAFGRPAGHGAPGSAAPGDDEPHQTAKWMMRPDLQHPHRARRALRAFVDHLDATEQPAPHPHVIDALNSALLAYDPVDGGES